MFKNTFSLEGRIRRSEYAISLIIVVSALLTLVVIGKYTHGLGGFVWIFLIPILGFLWGQATKRLHDIGNSGWWVLLTITFLIIIFLDGEVGENEYGPNPKGKVLRGERKVTLNQEKVTVYSHPNLSSEIITTFKKKDLFILCLTDENKGNQWDTIKLSDNEVGYIESNTRVKLVK